LLDSVDVWSGGDDYYDREVDVAEWVATVEAIITEYVGGLFGGNE